VQYATAKIGAILVNINPAYRTHELQYVLNQAGIKDARHRRRRSRPQLRGDDRGRPRRGAELGAGHRALAMRLVGRPVAMPTEVTQEELEAIASRRCCPQRPINIQYTSGTTGFPKGATLSHRNILNNGYLVGEVCRYTEEDRICIPVPFYHCFGMVMGNLARPRTAPAWSFRHPVSTRPRPSKPR
jgi:fatty-acyl-CoA synthase